MTSKELKQENRQLKTRIYELEFVVDSYWKTQGPLLLEIDRLKNALAEAKSTG